MAIGIDSDVVAVTVAEEEEEDEGYAGGRRVAGDFADLSIILCNP